ncbi:ComEC/Rec2 family competence protein [Microvirga flavescens]|uniref:ComEC/Rec2 family competence protein n=1 Tax=Microvirga flavescens TaxID=2249811 RepID=UPI000DD94A9B|nr:ComEC/Rec2 family competence protein [Microvirga flavescens]
MAEYEPHARKQVRPTPARVLSLAGPRLSGFVTFPDWRGWIAANAALEIEQRRLFPWIAVCFGLGIVLFFQADGRPALWAPLIGFALSVALLVTLRRSLWGLAVAIGFAALFAGFAAGVIRTRQVTAPVLGRVVIAPVSGFVESVEQRPQGARLLLRLTGMKDVPESERPRFVRVTLKKGEALSAGQYIEGTARLLPPPQPAWPGGYDFARDAFYKEIGAVGSMVGAIRYLPPPQPLAWDLWLTSQIDAARNALTERIARSIGGQEGAVGAALVTGKRGLIGETTNDVLRAAGIYHIVSISGLHMVLAAGTFFWLVRALLSLSPALALSWPVKKIAACAAMIGAVAYCIFSGSEVATERSLIMTLVMFGAILVDRPALSIRNLAIAALIVLAREPETILGPSFQMSFGAVAALTACAPLLGLGTPQTRAENVFDKASAWVFRGVTGLIITTLVASLATAPFTAYHFQTLNPLGLIGNALALPLVSIVVMPSALLGVIAYPFGLDQPVWRIMGLAVAKVLDVSAWVGGLNGATVLVPAMSVGAVVLMGLALIMATLMVSGLRWLAVIPASVGLMFAGMPNRVDAFIDRDGTGAAIRNVEGRLVLVGKPSRFVVQQWLQADGDTRSPDDKALREGVRCDRLGCVVETSSGRAVAFVQDAAAFEEDCRRAGLVIARLNAPATCGASLVLDKAALAGRGATTVRFAEGAMEMRSVNREGEARPWQEKLRIAATKPPVQEQPRPARPTPELDIPEEDVSSGAPD